MKRYALFVLSIALALGLAVGGCSTTPKASTTSGAAATSQEMTAKDFMAEAKKNICEISVADAKARLDQGGYLFLDCRTEKEYKMGHVPGAMNIARGLLEFKIDKKVPDKNTKIIMYFKTGR